MTAAKILSLIETAEPGDIKTLDEIDARVHAIVKGWVYKHTWTENWTYSMFTCPHNGDLSYSHKHATMRETPDTLSRHLPQYTRSRDALKSIRPPGRGYSMAFYGAYTSSQFWKCEINDPNICFASRGLPTEELAELHAIIQAIRHDRGETHG
jgi:hypothetical protein